jgi:hypothetical protein
MLIERFAEPVPFAPRCTIRGGVCPLSLSPALPGAAGELRRDIFNAGALLGVSNPAFPALTDRLQRGASASCSRLCAGELPPASASRACVTFENMIGGGGSLSESLSSPTSIRLIIGASEEKP